MVNIKDMPEDELKKKLSPEQYNVCVLRGTEMPGSGKYDKHFEEGVYKCVICDEELFKSDTKFDAGSGWPAFFQPLDTSKLKYIEDRSHGLYRTSIDCANCGSHLGHVFDVGNMTKTGMWFCVNSLSLNFEPKK